MLPNLARRAPSRLALINRHLSAPAAAQTLQSSSSSSRPTVARDQFEASASSGSGAASARMSSSSSSAPAPAPAAASKPEWLFVIPDHPNVLEKRMEVRGSHFSGLRDAPALTFGGALLASQVNPDQPGAPLQINGSAVTVEADTREEALAILKRDVYVTSGVWDLDRAQIFAFKTGVRKPQ